mmetsp:Transcript_6831/g.9628  ORF Transcript_6831/g.9628 Transcript_6831/m.9628 type:complete len:106 (-) Transcript_6831:2108-2425(-)
MCLHFPIISSRWISTTVFFSLNPEDIHAAIQGLMFDAPHKNQNGCSLPVVERPNKSWASNSKLPVEFSSEGSQSPSTPKEAVDDTDLEPSSSGSSVEEASLSSIH